MGKYFKLNIHIKKWQWVFLVFLSMTFYYLLLISSFESTAWKFIIHHTSNTQCKFTLAHQNIVISMLVVYKADMARWQRTLNSHCRAFSFSVLIGWWVKCRLISVHLFSNHVYFLCMLYMVISPISDHLFLVMSIFYDVHGYKPWIYPCLLRLNFNWKWEVR